MTTAEQPALTKPEIYRKLDQFDHDIRRDGMPFNAPLFWKVFRDPANQALRPDALLVLSTLTSLTPPEGGPCGATLDQIAARATTLQQFLLLVQQVGLPAMAECVGLTE